MGNVFQRISVIAIAISLIGCGVKTGAEAIVVDDRALMCRTVETERATWYLCRTHPAVTPDVLRGARELHEREGVSLPVAVGRLTNWRNYLP